MRVHLFVAALAAGVMGCEGTGRPALTEARLDEQIGVLKDGQTTREEVVSKLGPPSGSFEGGRILTWRLRVYEDRLVPLGRDAGGTDPRYHAWPPECHGYELVLVFDGCDRLERHSRIEVR